MPQQTKASQTHLEALEEVVVLFGRKNNHEVSEHVLHILDDGLVFANLGLPDLTQILQAECTTLNKESYDLSHLIDVLRLVEVLAQKKR